MRVIFMGTPDFAVPSLQALLTRHEVVAVVTQPDKPKGRGKKLQPTPVKAVALEQGIPVLQPVKVREPEVIEQLRGYGADLIAVTAFGQILFTYDCVLIKEDDGYCASFPQIPGAFADGDTREEMPEEILNMPKYGCINVHGSLLPEYRGAAPMQRAIIDGKKVTGITTMFMAKGMDTGDMLLKTEVEILPTDNFEDLHDKMAVAGAALLLETIDGLEKGTITRLPQDDAHVSRTWRIRCFGRGAAQDVLGRGGK